VAPAAVATADAGSGTGTGRAERHVRRRLADGCKYRGDGDVGAWLWGIAIRRLTDRLRKPAAPSPVPDEALASRSPVVASAEDQLLLGIGDSTVVDALQTLSPELVRVLQATVIDGLSTREAAQLLGIPHGTVKSRLRVAKVKLREQFISMEGWT
jgi:RNA polymerase sigma-70 factor, ECF subfamily